MCSQLGENLQRKIELGGNGYSLKGDHCVLLTLICHIFQPIHKRKNLLQMGENSFLQEESVWKEIHVFVKIFSVGSLFYISFDSAEEIYDRSMA